MAAPVPKFPKGDSLLRELPLKTLPKVLLHEHLDGGLRPGTILDLAQESGYDALPETEPAELAAWFNRGARRGSLAEYLEGFAHTIAVMQSSEALERVAFEFIEDMHQDGVVYAEARFAPVFHTQSGLTLEGVVQAVLAGLARGEQTYGVRWGLIICAMRDRTDSLEMAELAINFRHAGVVGFDLAGEEAGHPPKRHLAAFEAIRRANFNITIHAGEGFGNESIWQAIQYCGAHRLGHATRLIDDIVVVDDRAVQFGTLSQFVLDRRIPLEICLTSNVDTGAVPSFGEHPFKVFYDAGFRVCLNTDDRLMSATSMSEELERATSAFDLSLHDLEKLAVNGMKSAFLQFRDRIDVIYEKIKPGYAAAAERLRSSSGQPHPPA